jgi:hypothetical protein
LTEQELERKGYVMTSPRDLRVQLWEKHEGKTGQRVMTDQLLRCSVSGEIRDTPNGLDNVELEDLKEIAANMDFCEMVDASTATAAQKTRLKNRNLGGAVRAG